MIDQIKRTIFSSAPFEELKARLGQQEVQLRGISGSLLAFVAACAFEQRKTQILLLSAEEDSAEQLRDDLALLLGEPSVTLFTSSIAKHAKVLDMTSPIAQIETLQKLT